MATSPDRPDDAQPDTHGAQSGRRRSREQSQVEFELDFLSRVLERAPLHIDVLRVQAQNLAAQGLHHRALQLDRRLVRLCPDRPIPWYNLACSYAVLGMHDNAIAALHRSVDLGYRHAKHLRRDPDLKSLRLDPRFRALIQKMQPKHGSI